MKYEYSFTSLQSRAPGNPELDELGRGTTAPREPMGGEERHQHLNFQVGMLMFFLVVLVVVVLFSFFFIIVYLFVIFSFGRWMIFHDAWVARPQEGFYIQCF